MRTPRHPGPYPDRYLDCQEVLEDGVLVLLDQGEAAGRTRVEAAAALIDLADHIMIGDAEQADMERGLPRRE